MDIRRALRAATLLVSGGAMATGCVSRGDMDPLGDTRAGGRGHAEASGWVVVYGDHPNVRDEVRAPAPVAAPDPEPVAEAAPAAPAGPSYWSWEAEQQPRPLAPAGGPAPIVIPLPAAAPAGPGAAAPMAVRLRLAGIELPHLRSALLDRLGALPGADGIRVEADATGTPVIALRFAGSPADLAAALAALRGPRCDVQRLVLDVEGQLIDDLPPSAEILAPTAGRTLTAATVTVAVRADEPDVVGVRVNGVPAQRAEDGTWRASVPAAADGPLTLTAEAVDQAGNVGRDTIQVSIDTTPPDMTADAMVQINGRVDDPSVTVTVDGQPVPVRPDGTYATLIKLPPDRRVRIVATDAFGNATTRIVDFRD